MLNELINSFSGDMIELDGPFFFYFNFYLVTTHKVSVLFRTRERRPAWRSER